MKSEEGSISIYLMIVLSAFLLITCLLIDIARVKYINSKVERAGTVAVDSVLAGYNRELKEDYMLYAVRDLNTYEMERAIQNYFTQNMKEVDLSKYRNTGLFVEKQKTLEDLAEMERQIISAIGYVGVERILQFIQNVSRENQGEENKEVLKSKLVIESRMYAMYEKIDRINRSIGVENLCLENCIERVSDGRTSRSEVVTLHEGIIRDLDALMEDKKAFDKELLALEEESNEDKSVLIKIHRFKEEVENSGLTRLKSALESNIEKIERGDIDNITIIGMICVTNRITKEEYEKVKDYKDEDNRESVKKDVKSKLDANDGIEEKRIAEAVFEELPSQTEAELEEDFDDYSSYLEKSKNLLESIGEISGVTNDLLINEYILHVFNNAVNVEQRLFGDERFFKCEVEYVLNGKESQLKNYKGTKNKILMIRFVFNMVDVYNDEELKEKAYLIALAAVGWWAGEAAVEIVKNVILCAYSLNDLDKLLLGERVKLGANIEAYPGYEDYLRLLLLTVKKEERLKRIQDLIQLNLKEINWVFDIREATTHIRLKILGRERYLFMTQAFISKRLRFGNEQLLEQIIERGY